MPRSALNQVPNAHVLSLDQIAAFLLQVIGEELPSEPRSGRHCGRSRESAPLYWRMELPARLYQERASNSEPN